MKPCAPITKMFTPRLFSRELAQPRHVAPSDAARCAASSPIRFRKHRSANTAEREIRMNSWKQPATAALVSGSLAAVTSTAALAPAARPKSRDRLRPRTQSVIGCTASAPRGRIASRGVTTVVGYATHHVASLFWAFLYEKFFAARRARATPATLVGDAIAVAAVACFVDTN
jgi:hypothetical protein